MRNHFTGRWWAVIVLTVALLGASCGTDSSGTAETTEPAAETTQPAAETTQAAAETTSPDGGGDTASVPFDPELVAAAQEEGNVILYTSLDSRVVEEIANAFTDEFGIDVEFFRAGGPEVVTRTLQEADAGRLGADVLDIAEVAGLLVMKDRGILATYESPSAASVPAEFRDPDGTWTASRLRHAVVLWNTDLVSDPPTSLEDLGDPRWKDQIVMYFGDGGVASRLYAFVDKYGYEPLEPIGANAPMLVESSHRVTEVVEFGDRAIGFMTQDNTSWLSKQNDRPTDYTFYEEGTPTTMAGVAVVEDAAHPNAARLFVDWWLGDQAQGLLIEAGGYSARTDLNPPTGSPTLDEIDNLPEPVEEYQADRDAIHQRFEEIFGGDW